MNSTRHINIVKASIRFISDVYKILTKDGVLVLFKNTFMFCFSLIATIFNILFSIESKNDHSHSIHGPTEKELFSVDLEQTSKSINTHYRWWDR